MEDNSKLCEICGTGKGSIICAGCGKMICDKCAHFELLGSGCGTVYPLYYCSACFQDERINPNAGLQEKPW